MTITVYDRRTATLIEEPQYGAKKLHFLYETILGRIILRLFICGRWYSRFNARRENSPKSAAKIAPFVEQYGIDLSEFEQREYTSFADFFTRKILPERRAVAQAQGALIAVADSKLLAYRIGEDTRIPMKHSVYTVGELIGDAETAKQYSGGLCLVFRLTVDDYHHYCFPDSGRVLESRTIAGRLHTVSPISARRHKVYCENTRVISRLETAQFGEVMQIEVGALLVGKINNRAVTEFERGEEKGYFELGGSTCVLLFRAGTIVLDMDIDENSQRGIETKVRIGESIGQKED